MAREFAREGPRVNPAEAHADQRYGAFVRCRDLLQSRPHAINELARWSKVPPETPWSDPKTVIADSPPENRRRGVIGGEAWKHEYGGAVAVREEADGRSMHRVTGGQKRPSDLEQLERHRRWTDWAALIGWVARVTRKQAKSRAAP